uniref:Uncharacterized protein n=1 Tax=Meloidogyne javanica TaxID=6303 RepID=A0A915N1S6_MELJA
MGKKKLEERLLLIKHINIYVKTHQKAYAEWKSSTAVLKNISNSAPETLSERACEGLCSDEDFDKTKSSANKEDRLDDDSDEENEREAVAEKQKKRRQEDKCDTALLDPSGFAQEQLKKISGLYKDEKNANKFKYLGTEVLKIVEEIINNYDSFIMNAIIPAKKNKTGRDELTADIMREYKKIQAKGANASTSELSNEILQQLNSIKELLNSMQQSSDSDPAEDEAICSTIIKVEPFNEVVDNTNDDVSGDANVKEEVDMQTSEHDVN